MSTRHTTTHKLCPEDTVDLLIKADPIGHNQWRRWIENRKIKDPEAEKILRSHFDEVEKKWDTEAYSQLRHKSGGVGFPLEFEEVQP